jgi:hypothetical protein
LGILRRVNMQKATIGGILSIVAGAFGLLGGLILLVITLFFSSVFNDPSMFGNFTGNDQQVLNMIAVIYGVMGVFLLLIGVLGVVGGIFGIQRKHWGWALAGAIAGCFSFLPAGVAAVILIAMGKPEFDQAGTTPQPQGVNPA